MGERDGMIGMIQKVISHARKYHDGHFSILSFTAGYKGSFDTPDLDSGAGRDEVWNMPGYASLEELLEAMLSPSCGCVRL